MCWCKLIVGLGRIKSNIKVFNSLRNIILTDLEVRRGCHTNKPPTYIRRNEDDVSTTNPMSAKYEIFRDVDSPIIMDVEEERKKIIGKHTYSIEEDEFYGIDLQRGIHGVFDIEELVELLRKNNSQDIFVAQLPLELKYVDNIVVVTGKSQRQMTAIAEFVRKVYKKKRHHDDNIPKIEGENSKDWIAMDLGNIALHIFSKQARRLYDLECLWSVGAEYDELCNKPEDPLVKLLERHSVYLGDLQPAETRG